MTNPSIPLRLLALSLLLSVLPVLRAQTDPYAAYIERYKTLAVQQMYKYGIPASITLSQGLLESGAGKSLLAAKANNHFGIKAGPSWTGPVMLKDDDAVGEKFRVYPNVLASYEDHSLFLSRGAAMPPSSPSSATTTKAGPTDSNLQATPPTPDTPICSSAS